MSPDISFTQPEAEICHAIRLLDPKRTYWVAGGGEPLQFVLLAQQLYYPDLVFMTEDGAIGQRPMLPLDPMMAMVSSRSAYRAYAWQTMNEVQWQASVGAIDFGVLGCLQVDPFGNFNSSHVGGSYDRPARRFGGAGGANEIAALCWHTILITDQSKRKFVKQCDFVTSPGYLDGTPGARERAGLPRGTGPYRVVTDNALFGFDPATHRMQLLAVATWSSVGEVLAEMDFEPLIAEHLGVLHPPKEEELTMLRTLIDPNGQTIGVGQWITAETEEP